MNLLIHKNGKPLGQIYLKNNLSIGRAESNEIILKGLRTSKKHAVIQLDAQGQWVLEDLASMSGTYINEERIISQRLKPQDTIRINDYLIQIVEQDLNSHTNSASTHVPRNNNSSAGDFNQHSIACELTQQEFTQNQIPKKKQPNDALINTTNHLQNAFDQQRAQIHQLVLNTFDLRRKSIGIEMSEELKTETRAIIREVINTTKLEASQSNNNLTLEDAVFFDICGLGPLETLLLDDSISEIMVNSAQEIFVEKNGRIENSGLTFTNDAAVIAVIDRIITPIGRRIDESSPMVDARLKDGSRVNAIIPPLAIKGPCITIRKFPKHRLEISDLIRFQSMDDNMAEFLTVAVREGKNILVSGGTGTGKTTLLNVLSNLIPDSERVITIEDAAELQLNQPDLVSLEAKPANSEGKGAVPIRDLVKNALRMRPNRIVVGECRGSEALDMLQAMNTGHDGSLTTLHANTPRDALSRLEVMTLMTGIELPIQAIREQIASAVSLIVQQSRFPCGARKITYITEVVGMEAGIIQLQDIFRFQRSGLDDNNKVVGEMRPTGNLPEFYEELLAHGKQLNQSIFQSNTSSSNTKGFLE